MLGLPYEQFDQTFGSGFRVLYDREEYWKGGILIEDYLQRHRDLEVSQQKFLHLHAGQAFALANNNARALKHFDLAKCLQGEPEPGPNWNAMLVATSAFLKHDRPALLAAKNRMTAESPERARLVDRFIENLGSSYADALLWHRLSPTIGIPKDGSMANRAAAEKVGKAFELPVITVESNPPPRCIWIEQRPFGPNSPLYGYVIIHTGNGTLIAASNPYWLDQATERFIKLVRQRNGRYEAKFGLATNFDWIKR